MATINTGGSRASARPTYDPYQPQRTQAVNIDQEEWRRQMLAQQAGVANTDGNVGNNLSEALTRGFSTMEGQGGTFSAGSGGNSSNAGPASPGSTRGMGAVGTGISAVGHLAKDPGIATMGNVVGLSAAAMNAKNPGEVASAVATPALAALGVPTAAIGLTKAAVDNDISLAVNTTLSALSPALGAINALASVFGFGTLGSWAKGIAQNMSLANTVGDYGTAAAINSSPDPLGSLIGKMADQWGLDVGEGDDGGYTSSGPGAPGHFGGGKSGGGTPSGKNGGPGPGNNGGNASGAGSSQA